MHYELLKQAVMAKLFSRGDKDLEDKLNKWDSDRIKAYNPAKPYRQAAGITGLLGGAALGSKSKWGGLKGSKLSGAVLGAMVGGTTGYVGGNLAGLAINRKKIRKDLKVTDKYFKKHISPKLNDYDYEYVRGTPRKK